MILIYEGEILHTDSSTDIIEHYGVKGMKWGKRLHKYKVDRIKRRSTGLKAKNGDKLYLEKKAFSSKPPLNRQEISLFLISYKLT